MDGYVRIGNNNDTHNLRIITRNAHEITTKASFRKLQDKIKQHYEQDEGLQTRIKDPMTHIRNQCKESLAHLIDAFKEKNFQRGSPTSAEEEDAFELYSANYIVDNDLDVWLLDTQDDLDMDGTYAPYIYVGACLLWRRVSN
jgi:hypothetical protein